MTRLTHLLTALALAGALVAGAIAACGGNPIAPREMPPIAPRPERGDPTAMPVPTATDPGNSPIDAGRSATLSPISAMASPASMSVASASQPGGAPQDAGNTGTAPVDAGPADAAPADAAPADAGIGRPTDAGIADSQAPPLPPIPDGSLPADSRLEPIRLRDQGWP